jgi:hypothetical protein
MRMKGISMKRMIIAAAAAGLLGLGLMAPAAAMPVSSSLAPAVSSESDVIQVRGGRGHHGMSRRGGRGHHYGWSRGRHRGWR